MVKFSSDLNPNAKPFIPKDHTQTTERKLDLQQGLRNCKFIHKKLKPFTVNGLNVSLANNEYFEWNSSFTYCIRIYDEKKRRILPFFIEKIMEITKSSNYPFLVKSPNDDFTIFIYV